MLRALRICANDVLVGSNALSAALYRMCSRLRVQSSAFMMDMLEEILMDVVQQSHKEIARARAICDVCHTRCVPRFRACGLLAPSILYWMRRGRRGTAG